jgi:hypothetical protein
MILNPLAVEWKRRVAYVCGGALENHLNNLESLASSTFSCRLCTRATFR